ncbi:MAG: peptidylprolyl isomerase, partial [Rhodospirillales bacterium]
MTPILVNGVEIPERAVLAEMQHHPAGDAEEAMRLAAEALTLKELLLQEARRLGVEPASGGGEAPEEAAIRCLIEREVVAPRTDEETCRRYFDANRRRFRSPAAFEAEHILYSAASDDAAARLAARGRAQSALECVLGAPALFGKIARAESDCPSREQGGRLGPVQRGDVDPVFETYLMSLREGEICGQTVETKFGFHILRLARKLPGRELPFEHVRERIARYLEDRAWASAVRQYMSILAGRARIEG